MLSSSLLNLQRCGAAPVTILSCRHTDFNADKHCWRSVEPKLKKKRKKEAAEAGAAPKKNKKLVAVEQAPAEQPKQATATASNNSTASDDTTVGEEVAPQDPMAITNFRSALVFPEACPSTGIVTSELCSTAWHHSASPARAAWQCNAVEHAQV